MTNDVEYKINQAHTVRNDASYQKDYLAGKYGAFPFFGDMEKFIEDYSDGIQGREDALADRISRQRPSLLQNEGKIAL